MTEMTENTIPAQDVQPADDTTTAEMNAVWDKLTADGIEDEAVGDEGAPIPPAVEEKPKEEAKAEDAPAAQPAPADLPHAMKAHWDKIPEDAREGVLASYRELTGKLSSHGRQLQQFQGAAPIIDVLQEAVRSDPNLAGMAPAQVAQDVFRLAQLQSRLTSDPLGVIMEVAENYGALDQLRAHLAGQPIPAAQQRTDLGNIRQQVQQLTNPDAIGHIVEQALARRDGTSMVTEFAAQAPHWAAVEDVLPDFLPMAKARMPGAGHKEVLQAAYEMACYADPSIRAKLTAAPAPVTASPAMTAAQKNAKSVNIVSQPDPGKPSSVKDEMERVWAKHH